MNKVWLIVKKGTNVPVSVALSEPAKVKDDEFVISGVPLRSGHSIHEYSCPGSSPRRKPFRSHKDLVL